MRRAVRDVMTSAVVVVRDAAPFKEVVRRMQEHRVSALPVVDGEEHLGDGQRHGQPAQPG